MKHLNLASLLLLAVMLMLAGCPALDNQDNSLDLDETPVWNGVDPHSIGEEDVYFLSWSPDGKYLASNGTDGFIVWDPETGKNLYHLEGDIFAWSPDGKIAAVEHYDSIILWDSASGTKLQTFETDLNANVLVWSPDGSLIACGTWGSGVYLFDANSGEILRTFEEPKFLEKLSWSPDGKILAGGDDISTFWDPYSGMVLYTISRGIQSMRWSPDSRTLASGATLYDAADGEHLRSINYHIYPSEWSPDGTFIAGGRFITNTERDHFNAETRDDYFFAELTPQRDSYSDTIYDLSWSPDGNTLATLDGDGFVELWDAHTGNLLRTIEEGKNVYTNIVKWSPDGKILAVAGEVTDGGGIRLWKEIKEIHGFIPSDNSGVIDTSPTFTWNAVPIAVSYDLQIATSKGGVESAHIISRSKNEYTPSTPLEDMTTYYWRVRAVDNNGESSEWSDILSVTVNVIESVFIDSGNFQRERTIIEVINGLSFSTKTMYETMVSSFFMTKSEITMAQYDAYCDATGADKPGDSGWGRIYRPVHNVNWFDAVRFCNWLSEKDGFTKAYTIDGDNVTWQTSNTNGWRLPTETEWEYAARGGNKSKGYKYSGSNTADDVGWYNENSMGKTHPVGGKAANELGLYDMTGNVWEWCWDWYSNEYYSGLSYLSNPVGPHSGTRRVIRGGSHASSIEESYEVKSTLDTTRSNYGGSLGFRLVRGNKGFVSSVVGLIPTSSMDVNPTFSWNEVLDASSYEIQIADSEAGVSEAAAVTVSATEYIPTVSLTNHHTHYWRVRGVADNGLKGAWSSVASIHIGYAIGASGPAGGIVFYDKGDYSDGWRWLEAIKDDSEAIIIDSMERVKLRWEDVDSFETNFTEIGSTSTAIGTGKTNTEAIVNKLGNGSYAAKFCYDLDINGYDDWFLPSKDELNLLYEQKAAVGGFVSDGDYWSSSESYYSGAWYQNFDTGRQYYDGYYKASALYVRAVRAF